MKTRNRIVKEYKRLADAYDRKWAFYIEATTRETIARLPLRAEDRLLDIGCGTGALLHRLAAAHPACHLAGMDPVAKMLEAARHKLSPAVELRQGWAEQLPFADSRFDIVVSCNMFHFIDRPVDALGEIRRVLQPGGRLVITDWCGDYWACRLFEQYQRLLGRAHARIYRARECRRLLEQAGFSVEAIDTYKINWRWGLMTIRCIHAPAWAQQQACSLGYRTMTISTLTRYAVLAAAGGVNRGGDSTS
ncbi:Putative methyltransferase in menaquinone-biotin biosynthesi protein [Salinisphaera shabanensis E1L3A]|uniref:Methyltransferase in menaquinone-biotin biosynthesi protein n=1 Tax=Salinisphaera shabanensis E1L3A TaxID=1033802 RepID=U2FNX3_9GAMM|nr:class I SAM-dependent methyltransferase [Salinisphaera shabanensis]ERJ17879.1 Putative methyltransferase in menaquinone-biotin biosynthesi protein [Salinisphaera shabanensis E1L3A]